MTADMIAEEFRTDDVPASSPAPDSDNEQMLAAEIIELWGVHVQTKSTIKHTKEELKAVRHQLGQRLHEMKQILSRPGRGGQWSAWLRHHHISRATADRLVDRHLAAGPGGELSHEAIASRPQEIAESLAKDMWPRLRRVLSTDAAVVQFIRCIAEHAGLSSESRNDGGLVIFRNPVPASVDELAGAPTAGDPAGQDTDGIDGITGELSAEATSRVASSGNAD